MKKFLSSVLTAAAVAPLFWFTVNPALVKYAEKDANGNFRSHFLTTGPMGQTIPALNSVSQVKLADLIVRFPR